MRVLNTQEMSQVSGGTAYASTKTNVSVSVNVKANVNLGGVGYAVKGLGGVLGGAVSGLGYVAGDAVSGVGGVVAGLGGHKSYGY